MKYRNLSLIVLFCIVASLLVACGDEPTSPPASSNVTISIPLFGKGKDTPSSGQPGATQGSQASAPVTTLMSGKDIYSALSVDSSNVYFVSAAEINSENFAVMGIFKVSKSGEKSSPQLVYKGVATGNGGGFPIIGDEDNLYLVKDQVDLVKLDKKSGTTTTLSKGDPSNTDKGPAELAQDADNIYWLTNYTGEVFKISKKGGTPVTLVPAFTGTSVSAGLGHRGIVVDSSAVYYFNGVKGTLERVDKNGGNPAQLLKFDNEEMMPGNIVLDNNFLYWIGTSYGANKDIVIGGILKLPKNGGGISAVPVKKTDQFEEDAFAWNGGDGLVLSGNTFYWISRTFKPPARGEVRRVGTDGGVYGSAAVFEKLANQRLAADDKNLYWVSGDQTLKVEGGQTILRAPK